MLKQRVSSPENQMNRFGLFAAVALACGEGGKEPVEEPSEESSEESPAPFAVDLYAEIQKAQKRSSFYQKIDSARADRRAFRLCGSAKASADAQWIASRRSFLRDNPVTDNFILVHDYDTNTLLVAHHVEGEIERFFIDNGSDGISELFKKGPNHIGDLRDFDLKFSCSAQREYADLLHDAREELKTAYGK